MPNKRYRVDRLAEQIQREVDDILLKRVRDPRVQDITITGVDVTGDLQQATIYYSLLSDKASDGEKAQQGLDKAKGLIRSELGSRLNIFKTPELTFKRDPSVAYGSRIDQLINQLHKQERSSVKREPSLRPPFIISKNESGEIFGRDYSIVQRTRHDQL